MSTVAESPSTRVVSVTYPYASRRVGDIFTGVPAWLRGRKASVVGGSSRSAAR